MLSKAPLPLVLLALLLALPPVSLPVVLHVSAVGGVIVGDGGSGGDGIFVVVVVVVVLQLL